METLNSWQGAEIDYLPGTLQIDLFGRGKNTYHWPGEADVFEAIEFAKKAYKVDPERMTLRGFSMGGAGVWHTVAAFPGPLGGGRSRRGRQHVAPDSDSRYRCRRFSRRCARSSTTCTSGRSMLTTFRLPRMSAKTTGALVKHNSAKEQLIRDGIQFEGRSVLAESYRMRRR